jgi:hypothetical protein
MYRKEGEMEVPLQMLPLCCNSLITGYFHHLVVLPRLPKPRLGKSARDKCVYNTQKLCTAIMYFYES